MVSVGDVLVHRGDLQVDLTAAEHRARLGAAVRRAPRRAHFEPRIALGLPKGRVGAERPRRPCDWPVVGTPLTVIRGSNVRDGLRRGSLVATRRGAGRAGLARRVKFTLVPVASEWRGAVPIRVPRDWSRASEVASRLRARDRRSRSPARRANQTLPGGTADELASRRRAIRRACWRHPPVDRRRAGVDRGQFTMALVDAADTHLVGTVARRREPFAVPRRPRRHGSGRLAGGLRSGLPLGATPPRVGVDFAGHSGVSDDRRPVRRRGPRRAVAGRLSIKSYAVASSTGISPSGRRLLRRRLRREVRGRAALRC